MTLNNVNYILKKELDIAGELNRKNILNSRLSNLDYNVDGLLNIKLMRLLVHNPQNIIGMQLRNQLCEYYIHII
jgi:hypothetical protein